MSHLYFKDRFLYFVTVSEYYIKLDPVCSLICINYHTSYLYHSKQYSFMDVYILVLRVLVIDLLTCDIHFYPSTSCSLSKNFISPMSC